MYNHFVSTSGILYMEGGGSLKFSVDLVISGTFRSDSSFDLELY